jgi:hypothetical protein
MENSIPYSTFIIGLNLMAEPKPLLDLIQFLKE